MRSPWLSKLSLILGPRPPLNWLLLCLISVLVLIALLGSSSSSTFDSITSNLKPDTYTNYRRLKEQTTDYLELKTSLSVGTVGLSELPFCGKERENYVPCYNVTANLLAGYNNGEEFDRHCEVSHDQQYCLIHPPKDYKIPLRWPMGKDVIWSGNVKISKDQFLSSGSMTKRLMLLEENQIAFHSEDGMLNDDVKDYSRQIADMIGLGSDSEFFQAGVQNVLDIGCGFGSFGAHLLSRNVMATCIAAYEATGSQVQLALERGLPAIIGNFISKQLPYPSLSFDMVHCAQCGIVWETKEGAFLIEVDRILKPGGYFVLTSPTTKSHTNSLSAKRASMMSPIQGFSERLCWNLVAQQDETFIWQKTDNPHCYSSRKSKDVPLCNGNSDAQSYYQPLLTCLSGTNKRWIPVQNKSSATSLSVNELQVHGVVPEEFLEEHQNWRIITRDFWSLLTPLIFSDHPKRPGDEDPLPPYNMIRNVMDMNAHYGSFNAAVLDAQKSVWVMNVVPVGAPNTLPLLFDQGFTGVLHDWCEPFPTYPRTYDMLHANGLLSHIISARCSLTNVFLEMDRILRPEGWVIIIDKTGLIEKARHLATQVRFEARVIDLQNGSDQRILLCQKQFLRR